MTAKLPLYLTTDVITALRISCLLNKSNFIEFRECLIFGDFWAAILKMKERHFLGIFSNKNDALSTQIVHTNFHAILLSCFRVNGEWRFYWILRMLNFCWFLGGHFANEGVTFSKLFFEQKRSTKYIQIVNTNFHAISLSRFREMENEGLVAILEMAAIFKIWVYTVF